MRKALKWVLIGLVCATVLSAAGLAGLQYYNDNYVNISGVSYPKDTQFLNLSGIEAVPYEQLPRFEELRELDLRRSGVTPSQYEWLRRQMPGCAILWELPFQGEFYDRSVTAITVTSLTPEEVEVLDYLPLLSYVDAWECRDYEALVSLQHRRPDCKVFYNVLIREDLYDCDTAELSLTDPVELELERILGYFPRLARVRLTGKLPPARELLALRERFPQVNVSWQLELEGETLDSEASELDLSGRPGADVVELDGLLNYFPELRILRLGDTEIPEEALLALENGHPGLTIYWTMEVLGVRVSRDAEELDISGRTVADVAALEQRLKQMPRLRRVIMCGCGLSSEEMDQLDQRYENIRFVWSVNLGGILLRTDATWYCPNKYYLEVTDADIQELRYCYDMVGIDIGHMRGVTHCQWAASMPNLKYLVIADTNIKDLSPLSGLPDLVFLEVFMSPVRDYRPLQSCTALEDLNLGYTYGDPTPVLSMTWLQRLWWPGALRVLNWNVRNQLRTNLPDAKMNFVAGSSTGEGWRTSPNYYAMRDLMGMPYMTG